MFEVLEEAEAEDSGFKNWLSATKTGLAETKGPYWLGKNKPFPFSTFMPKPVLNEQTKRKIFELHQTDVKTNDYRALSARFKVSIERVKAVIRQKSLELDLARAGHAVPAEYTAAMEANLGSHSNINEEDEILNTPRSLPIRPMLLSVPEGCSFSFQDAKAAILQSGINLKSTKRNVKAPASEAAQAPSTVKVLQQSPFERSRFKFVFVDTSSEANSPEDRVLVRDRDGVLRTAHRHEHNVAARKTWSRKAKPVDE